MDVNTYNLMVRARHSNALSPVIDSIFTIEINNPCGGTPITLPTVTPVTYTIKDSLLLFALPLFTGLTDCLPFTYTISNPLPGILSYDSMT